MAKTPYELLNIHPGATPREIRGAFRRFVARYRSILTVQEVAQDPRFRDVLHAYVELMHPHGPAAVEAKQPGAVARHVDDARTVSPQSAKPTAAATKPFDALDERESSLLMAHIAYWRGEMAEVTHLLRGYLERFPDESTAWALLGEVFLAVGRIQEGLRAYQGALKCAPHQTAYANRLKHIEECLAGKCVFQPEDTPEEEMLREERLRRWRMAALFGAFGLMVLLATLLIRGLVNTTGFLAVPWQVVFLQCAGFFFLIGALAYGRVLQPFEQEMLWSTLYAADRSGVSRHLPSGVLMLVLSCVTLWFAVFGYLIMARIEEEWQYSTALWLGITLLITIATAVMLAMQHLPYMPMLIVGGNLPAIAGMIGWWAGSLFKTQVE